MWQRQQESLKEGGNSVIRKMQALTRANFWRFPLGIARTIDQMYIQKGKREEAEHEKEGIQRDNLEYPDERSG